MIKAIYKEVDRIVQDINQEYIREATRLWDLGEVECPVFSIWIQIYIDRKWIDMVRRN